MNKLYNEPEFKVVVNKTEDVIATSIDTANFEVNNGFDVPNTDTENEFVSTMMFM